MRGAVLRGSIWARAWLALAGTLAVSATSPEAFHVERLDLPGISSPEWESHPAIDPRTGDLWFVRSDANFAGWRLLTARCTKEGWQRATSAAIAAPGLEADPWFTADGSILYFISTRANAKNESRALDIWQARRDRHGNWAPPERLSEPVNSDAAEWFPRPAPDGWLYFGSRRAGGLGKDDIWRARKERAHWRVENAGPAINGPGAEYEFQPSPDGRWALLATDEGLYRVEHGSRGWQRRVRYDADINATGAEIGPMIVPNETAFVFSRDAGAGRSGELFLAYQGRKPLWPVCRNQPRHRR
jgi:hypothetical protein